MKKQLLLVVALLMTAVVAVNAQFYPPLYTDPIPVESSTYSSPRPFETSAAYSFTQQIYTAAELGNQPMTIMGISFLKTAGTYHQRHLKVYLANVSRTNFNGDFLTYPTDSFQLVFDRVYNFQDQNRWENLWFNTNFQYDGVHNLAVYVVDETGVSDNGTNTITFATTPTSYGMPTGWGSSPCNADNFEYFQIESRRNIIRLMYPEEVGLWGITIGESEITTEMNGQLDFPEITSGTVSFDSATHVLSFNNATVSDLYIYPVRAITLQFEGNNTINGRLDFESEYDITFTGGSLAIQDAMDFIGDMLDENDTVPVRVVYDNMNLTNINHNYHYSINGSDHTVLEINNCNVNLANRNFPIIAFDELILSECSFIYPANAYYDEGEIRFVDADNQVVRADSIVIGGIHVDLDIVNTTEFSIVPNPAVDRVVFQGVHLADGGIINIVDASGRLVLNLPLPAYNGNYSMDVNGFQSGVYFVTITSGNTRYTAKLVKK